MLDPIKEALFSLLTFFKNFVGGYGLAIILLTVTVRGLLLPLTIKQTRSIKEMQRVQPKLKELQEKYKDNKEKLQKEMMAFYSENKINPLAGCLPLLLQFPFLIAIYQVLVDKELKTQMGDEGFLWIAKLSEPDFVMIALMIGTTYLSMIISATDSQQSKMMLPMTLMIGFIGISLPAGVLLYWVTSNIFSVSQQVIQVGPPPFLLKKPEEPVKTAAPSPKGGKSERKRR